MNEMRDYVLKLDESGLVTEVGDSAERTRLYLPKEAVGFADPEVLIYVAPDCIEVEEGNPSFRAESGCLIRKADNAVVLVARGATVPDGVKIIGDNAFCWYDDPGTSLNPLRLPRSVREIRYRAFAVRTDAPIHVAIPKSVEYVGLMALMAKCKGVCRVTFAGDPELDTGVFGTKAELMDTEWDTLHKLPECVYTRPEDLLVTAPKGSGVMEYCRKYGIPCKRFDPLGDLFRSLP